MMEQFAEPLPMTNIPPGGVHREQGEIEENVPMRIGVGGGGEHIQQHEEWEGNPLGVADGAIVASRESLEIGKRAIIPAGDSIPDQELVGHEQPALVYDIGEDRMVELVKRANRSKVVWIAAGALALTSLAITVVETAIKSSWGQLIAAMPEWALVGAAVSEGLFALGGAMMLSAMGVKGWKRFNPFGIRKRLGEFQEQALNYRAASDGEKTIMDNPLFRAGFIINAIGAIGTAAFAGAGVLQMPREAWGLLPLVSLDIAATIGTRIAVKKGIELSALKRRLARLSDVSRVNLEARQ